MDFSGMTAENIGRKRGKEQTCAGLLSSLYRWSSISAVHSSLECCMSMMFYDHFVSADFSLHDVAVLLRAEAEGGGVVLDVLALLELLDLRLLYEVAGDADDVGVARVEA